MIGVVDLVPTLEEYDHFLSPSTPISIVFIPPMWTHYHKRLADLMGFKRLVVEVLTWHGNEVGGSSDRAPFTWTDRRSDNVWPPESVTLTVNSAVPDCVGVPERTPAALKLRPKLARLLDVADHV